MSITTPQDHADLATCRAWLRARVVDVVLETYRAWDARQAYDPLASEPSITVGYMAGYLRQTRLPFELRARAHFLDRECRNALESGRRKGLLGSSIGIGLHGREARCYEPPPARG